MTTSIRALYALIALLVAPLLGIAAFTTLDHQPSHTGNDFLRMLALTLGAAFALLLPSARAWWRLLRREELLAPERVAARPAVAVIVAIASVVAIVALLLRNDVPQGWWVAMASAATAMFVGEWVLIGRDR